MLRIGVSGDVGSFSEEAGFTYAAKAQGGESEMSYLIDMEGVLAALSRDEIDVGIFPFVNYNSGIVLPAFSAMGKYSFVPIDDLQLNVEQCLMAKSELALSEIKELYSFNRKIVYQLTESFSYDERTKTLFEYEHKFGNNLSCNWFIWS